MNKEIYEKYKAAHPEEMQRINRLKMYSSEIEKRLEMRRREKLKKIEECRRFLYGE